MYALPLHATGEPTGLRPGPVLVGALVGVAVWFAIRWLAIRRSAGRRGGT